MDILSWIPVEGMLCVNKMFGSMPVPCLRVASIGFTPDPVVTTRNAPRGSQVSSGGRGARQPPDENQFILISNNGIWYKSEGWFSSFVCEKELLLSCEIYHLKGFPGDSGSKDSACNTGDPGFIPGSGRSPGEGNGYLLQYPCLENPMDRGAWQITVHGVAKNWTRLSD